MLSTSNTQPELHISIYKIYVTQYSGIKSHSKPDEKDNELPPSIFCIVFFCSEKKNSIQNWKTCSVKESQRDYKRTLILFHWRITVLNRIPWHNNASNPMISWTSTFFVSFRMIVNCKYLAANNIRKLKR